MSDNNPTHTVPFFAAWFGLDHLYETCPGYQRTPFKGPGVGEINPLGDYVCGWCRRKWKGKTDE